MKYLIVPLLIIFTIGVASAYSDGCITCILSCGFQFDDNDNCTCFEDDCSIECQDCILNCKGSSFLQCTHCYKDCTENLDFLQILFEQLLE